MKVTIQSLLIPQDWANHYIYGMWVAFVATLAFHFGGGVYVDDAVHYGALVGATVGVLRELYALIWKDGEASWADLAWTMGGAFMLEVHWRLLSGA